MGLKGQGAALKKRWMLRYFGASTEIVVWLYIKMVCWGVANDGR